MVKRFIKPYKFKVFIGSVAKLVEALLELYLPIIMATILDIGIPNGDKGFILKAGLKIFLFAGFGFVCATICQYTAALVSQNVAENIRNSLMRHISKFSYIELEHFGTSTLVNRLTSDINSYQHAVVMVMRMGVRGPAIGIGAIVMSLLIDVKLALIFIVLVPILTIIIFFFMKYTSPLFMKAHEKLDGFSLIVRENLSGVRVIRAFAKEEDEAKKADISIEETADSYAKVGSIFALMQPINSVFLNGAIILVLYFGMQRFFAGIVGRGDILSLTIYANKVLYSLLSIASLVNVITKGGVAGERILDVLEVEPSIIEGSMATPNKSNDYPILEFENANFSYNANSNLLNNISFSVEKGSIFGIVGVTGSGKSTVLSLVQRMYDPSSGNILLCGANIKDYKQEELHNKIAIVPQKNILFTGTIAENLRLVAPAATKEDIVFALTSAQCWDFVANLPDGINSPVFEGGKNFSGGQKQRLTIARALVNKPDILLLDDSLSALDYKTDYELRKSLKTHYKNMTTVIVSQRISSVISADQIAVIDNGNIVGIGKHALLLRTCETYKEIYQSQVEQNPEDKEDFNE